MTDPVRVFFSFSDDDNTYYDNLVGHWSKNLKDDALAKIGDTNVVDFYYCWDLRGTMPWEPTQQLAVEVADIFVPFVSARYLSENPDDQRYKELDNAIRLWYEKELDMFPIVLAMPDDSTLDGIAKIHWDDLKGAPFRVLGKSDNGQNITVYNKLPSFNRRVSSDIPPVLEDDIFNQILALRRWIKDDNRETTRPSLRMNEQYEKRLAERLRIKDNVLCQFISKTSPTLVIPDWLKSYDVRADLTEPCFQALVKELVFLLEMHPDAVLVKSWLQNNFGVGS